MFYIPTSNTHAKPFDPNRIKLQTPSFVRKLSSEPTSLARLSHPNLGTSSEPELVFSIFRSIFSPTTPPRTSHFDLLNQTGKTIRGSTQSPRPPPQSVCVPFLIRHPAGVLRERIRTHVWRSVWRWSIWSSS